MDFIQNIPVLNPPPGTTSNFVNPKTVAPGLIAINAVFVPLMLISVAIRVYVKGFIVRAIGWDDCKLAAVMFCGLAIYRFKRLTEL